MSGLLIIDVIIPELAQFVHVNFLFAAGAGCALSSVSNRSLSAKTPLGILYAFSMSALLPLMAVRFSPSLTFVLLECAGAVESITISFGPLFSLIASVSF